jgi:ATP phosphoribosyltransferase
MPDEGRRLIVTCIRSWTNAQPQKTEAFKKPKEKLEARLELATGDNSPTRQPPAEPTRQNLGVSTVVRWIYTSQQFVSAAR